MNILSEINEAGLFVSMVRGNIEVANPSKLTTNLRNFIVANKQEIIKQLTSAQIQHEIRGRLEDKPVVLISYCYRTTDKPKSILIVNTAGASLQGITETLQRKYGDRLIEVYPMPTRH